jgi:hypothetical protein
MNKNALEPWVSVATKCQYPANKTMKIECASRFSSWRFQYMANIVNLELDINWAGIA